MSIFLAGYLNSHKDNADDAIYKRFAIIGVSKINFNFLDYYLVFDILV